MVIIGVSEWRKRGHDYVEELKRKIGPSPWIVRSSSNFEDNSDFSNAGLFLSVLDVSEEDLEQAIERVIGSYEVVQNSDEVLIQPMLTDVSRSGVVFSHDPSTSAPYRIINWIEGEDTTLVTGGRAGRIWQQAAESRVSPPEDLSLVLELLNELLELFKGEPIDFEFAVTKHDGADKLWLLQVRPLLLREEPESSAQQRLRLEQIHSRVAAAMRPQPFISGRRTIFGVMPDWNPAEIIGIRPKSLSLSLYRELVTDSIWAYQRHNYGYRNLRSFPLMANFFGLPYIDARVSFNSFVPADLNEELAGRLVDAYLNQLAEHPHLHDKVEFEIVYSCYTLDVLARLEKLRSFGFTDDERTEIAESLKRLTNRIVDPLSGLWKDDAAKIDELGRRRSELFESQAGPVEKIYWLIEDCKRYGTLPFAGLARAGFVAVQLLRSLVSTGIFSQEDHDAFLQSLTTVSGQMARDRAILDRDTFLAVYGHLRPGTYDITSPRYDDTPELYFNWGEEPEPARPKSSFSLTLQQMRQIESTLTEHGLETDPLGLLTFMQSAIELRELSKFHFSRNLSDSLALISAFGAEFGFSNEELAHADIGVFKELYLGAANPEQVLGDSIHIGKKAYSITKKLSLPPLITSPDQVWAFERPEASPNFITQKEVTAPVVSHESLSELAGAIVAIPNADPGFDWLFTIPIAGLITAWGGANSHMAIRAGELGLPAVIGAGEALFSLWTRSNVLRIDCANCKVEVVS